MRELEQLAIFGAVAVSIDQLVSRHVVALTHASDFLSAGTIAASYLPVSVPSRSSSVVQMHSSPSAAHHGFRYTSSEPDTTTTSSPRDRCHSMRSSAAGRTLPGSTPVA